MPNPVCFRYAEARFSGTCFQVQLALLPLSRPAATLLSSCDFPSFRSREPPMNMFLHIIFILFLLVNCNSWAAKLSPHCKRLVTKDHLKNLSDLIDTQMKSSCQISFNYVKESDLNHPVCFLKAAYRPLGNLLRNEMKFKENTENSRIQEMLFESHANLDEECFKTKADESQSSARCIKKFSLSAEEMLELVHRYFSLAAELIFKGKDFSQDCSIIFQRCTDSQNEAAFSSDKSSQKPELRDGQRMALIYVLVPSVLGILLAVGGLLFYLHKSRMLARRRQERMGSDMEEQEGSPLRGGEDHLELQMQGEL